MTDMQQFTGKSVYPGESLEWEQGALTITATIEYDSDHGTPWDECDGHGPVSEWTRRAKRPGEFMLCRDRDSFRYHDFQEACRIARRDGWNARPYDTIETPRQRAARAAMADYQFLRAWCNDEWFWCGIVVTVTHTESGHELASESLWGIESCSVDCVNDYLPDCVLEAIERAKELSESLKGIMV